MNRVEPGPGQESVWDFPRPPRVEDSGERVVVRLHGAVIADTTDALRVLETSHPPAYYLPRSAFADGVLQAAEGSSFCEYKGAARYLSVGSAERAAWFYPSPSTGYERLVEHVALYPAPFDIEVAGETVLPQAGGFYGGWITSRVVGPFKGEPGTAGW